MSDRPFSFDFSDRAAAAESIDRWLAGEDVFIAVAIYELDCGHVRPLNRELALGHELLCLACYVTRLVVDRAQIEPTLFPSPAA